MRFTSLAALTCSALLLAGTASVIVSGAAPAAAAARVDGKAAKRAAGEAKQASKALASKKWNDAVRHAELAVSLSPQDAGYRATLGAAYLRAGRFASAHQAFADVLTLQPDNGRAALNLSLAQIAEGKWDEARRTLADNQARITPADRGLALALAGDTAGGVDILTAATRTPDADAKTRQNLALALALSGRWPEARALIGVDMDPAEADARVAQWAVFAKPAAASDQVATLLGVTPALDPGQPVAIALNAPVQVSGGGDTLDTYMPGRQPTMAEQTVTVPTPTPAAEVPAVTPVAYHDVATGVAVPAPAVDVAPVKVDTFFAPRVRRPVLGATVAAAPTPAKAAGRVAEARLIAAPGAYKSALAPQQVAAAKPVKPVIASAKPAKVAVASASAVKASPTKPVAKPVEVAAVALAAGKGAWFVQLGAYPSAPVAKDGWTRATRRYSALTAYKPAGMTASVKGASFYRLSVGGFARPDAEQLCRGYRAKGGVCFVRAGAGEQTAAWRQPTPVQVAKIAAKKAVQVAKASKPVKKPVEVASR